MHLINLDKKFENKLSLILVVVFAFLITSSIIYLNSTHSILGHSYRDVYFYLIQSLRFSGADINGYNYVNYLPPFIPFLTSILFRLGFVSEASIFFTSGIFFFFGILGMYYILKLKFNNFYSIFGSFIYATLFMNINWVANGTLDIAFVAVMLWALYFFIQAVEKNQKYFYIAFPLAVISFFTKYPAGLIAPLMILYFLAKSNFVNNIKKYFKNLVGGVIAGILTAIPFFAYFFICDVPLGFLNQAEGISSQSSLTATSGGKLIGNDLFFYIKGLVYYISSTDYFVGMIILAITFIGFILIICIFGNTLKDSFSKIKESNSLIYKFKVPSKVMYYILVISIILILVSFFTASLFSFIYSEILLFAGLYLFAYSFTKILLNYEGVEDITLTEYPNLVLSIVMAGFFLSYLVFFSAHLIKADRYFTSMAPGFIFLLTLSVETLIRKIKGFEFRKINLKYAIPIFMMLLMVFASFNFIININDEMIVINEKETAEWIANENGIILSDRGPIYTWYLQKEVPYARYAYDNNLLNQELQNASAKYYITINPTNLTSYIPIKEFGNVTVYKQYISHDTVNINGPHYICQLIK